MTYTLQNMNQLNDAQFYLRINQLKVMIYTPKDYIHFAQIISQQGIFQCTRDMQSVQAGEAEPHEQ